MEILGLEELRALQARRLDWAAYKIALGDWVRHRRLPRPKKPAIPHPAESELPALAERYPAAIKYYAWERLGCKGACAALTSGMPLEEAQKIAIAELDEKCSHLREDQSLELEPTGTRRRGRFRGGNAGPIHRSWPSP